MVTSLDIYITKKMMGFTKTWGCRIYILMYRRVEVQEGWMLLDLIKFYFYCLVMFGGCDMMWWIKQLWTFHYMRTSSHCFFNACRCEPRWNLKGATELGTGNALGSSSPHENFAGIGRDLPNQNLLEISIQLLGNTGEYPSNCSVNIRYPFKMIVADWEPESCRILFEVPTELQ